MNIAFYTIIAVLPSIIWLLFYLRKDKHPEPNRMVIKIFFWGILSTFAVFVLEILYQKALEFLALEYLIVAVIGGMAFIEEYLKYFVVKWKVLNNAEFDEPTDAMLYMIIAALGFAAAENILLLHGLSLKGVEINAMIEIIIGRFLGAVFLHALASGIVGYFIARSLLLKHKRKIFVGLGIIIATCLHGTYNYIIIELLSQGAGAIKFLVILLGLMAIVVSLGFKNLKKLKSICKI